MMLRINLSKPFFSIQYTKYHQKFETSNPFKIIKYAIKTFCTGGKFIEIADKSANILKRPTVCTVISSWDNDARKAPKYCPVQDIKKDKKIDEPGINFTTCSSQEGGFEHVYDTELPFPEQMLAKEVLGRVVVDKINEDGMFTYKTVTDKEIEYIYEQRFKDFKPNK